MRRKTCPFLVTRVHPLKKGFCSAAIPSLLGATSSLDINAAVETREYRLSTFRPPNAISFHYYYVLTHHSHTIELMPTAPAASPAKLAPSPKLNVTSNNHAQSASRATANAYM